MKNSTQQSYPIGRINVQGKAKFSPKDGGRHLYNTIKYHWPQDTEVDILITPGGFIFEKVNDCWDKTNKKWYGTKNDIKDFDIQARENVESMLNSRKILKEAEGKCKFITIGSDVRYRSDHFWAELVYLVDVKKGKIVHFTGKSYPVGQFEEQYVVQVTDLETHFKKISGHRVMILGCHDLKMFDPRGNHNAKKNGDRWKRFKKMAKLAKEFEPTMVIQHPHYTDTPKTWIAAWNNLNRKYPSIESWASGISHFNHGDPLRAKFKKVLQKTKSGDHNVLDIKLVKKK